MSAQGAPPTPALVQVRRVVPAPREDVFRAWTDPELVRQWFRPRGGSSPSAEMDVRVGGRYRWAMKLLGHVYYAVGEYLEVDPQAAGLQLRLGAGAGPPDRQPRHRRVRPARP